MGILLDCPRLHKVPYTVSTYFQEAEGADCAHVHDSMVPTVQYSTRASWAFTSPARTPHIGEPRAHELKAPRRLTELATTVKVDLD